jgi:uncharacterized RDD family membrane protein YckC
MADYYGEEEAYEVAPVGTGYWGKRTVAYLIDSIFVLFPLVLFAYAIMGWGFIIAPLSNPFMLLVFSLIFGIMQVLYFAYLEGTGERSYTIGKAIVKLEVFSLEGGPVTGGQAFKRNASKILKVLLLIDIIMGLMSKRREDYTQKGGDVSARTALQIIQPAVAPPRRAPYKSMQPAKKKDDDDLKGAMDFPAHLLNGECPKCHSAYKIVPPDDRNTWSGLWNYRCTWCNKLVFDERPGRVQPPKWY